MVNKKTFLKQWNYGNAPNVRTSQETDSLYAILTDRNPIQQTDNK